MRKDRVLNRIKKGTSKHTLYAKIAIDKEKRDKSLSIFKDVNELMLGQYSLLRQGMTYEGITDEEQQEKQERYIEEQITKNWKQLNDLYAKKFKFLSDDQVNEIKLEQKKLIQDFYSVYSVYTTEKKTNRVLTNLKKQEVGKEYPPDLSPEQKEEKQIENDMRHKSKSEQEILIIKEQVKALKTFNLEGGDYSDYRNNMIKALENSLPPKFCYRKLLAASKSICPDSHPVPGTGNDCSETCDQTQTRQADQLTIKSTFKFWFDQCWEHCDYQKDPKCQEIFKIIYPDNSNENWHFQRTQFPEIIHLKENDKQQITCGDGGKPVGVYCYDNKQTCEGIGYENCGFAACSLNSMYCVQVLSDMVLQTLIGIGKFSLLFIAPGTVQAFNTLDALQFGYSLDTYTTLTMAMLTSRNELVKAFNNPIRKAKVIKNAVEYMKINKYDQIDGKLKEHNDVVEDITQIYKDQVEKIEKSYYFNEFAKNTLEAEKSSKQNEDLKQDLLKGIVDKGGEFLILKEADQSIQKGQITINKLLEVKGKEVFNIFQVKSIIETVQKCSADMNQDCVKNMLGVIAMFDPSGIAGIAKAFIYPTCEDY